MVEPRLLERYVPGRPNWWEWLTVLSLDAPVVAIAWQAALARAAGLPPSALHAFILGSSVWLAYTADRWIEGCRLDPEQVRTQRHWFHQRWRRPLAAVWATVLGSAVALSVLQLTRRELAAGLLLLGPVLVYQFSHQLVHRDNRWRAPKEICVALLFSAGVVCFPVADRFSLLADVALPLTLFGLLCFADCALISLWEHEVDRAHGQTSLALQFPRGRILVRALPWSIAAVGAAFAAHPRLTPPGVTWCAAASGGLLGSVDLARPRLGRQLARVLADVALMTPFVLLALESAGLA